MTDLIDPDHLTQTELEEEFSVRRIRERGPLGIPLLKQAFADEAAGKVIRPSALPNTRTHTHIRRCEEIAYEIAQAVSHLPRERASGREPALLSRFLTLSWRLVRLSHVAVDKEKDTIASLQSKLEEIGKFVDASLSPTNSVDDAGNTFFENVVISSSAPAGVSQVLSPVSSLGSVPPTMSTISLVAQGHSTGAVPKHTVSTGQSLEITSTRGSVENRHSSVRFSQAATNRSTPWDFPQESATPRANTTSVWCNSGVQFPYQDPVESHRSNDFLDFNQYSYFSDVYDSAPARRLPDRGIRPNSSAPGSIPQHAQYSNLTSARRPDYALGPRFVQQPAHQPQQLLANHLPQRPPYYPPARPGSIHLMSKWSLKYKGTSSGLHVDDFLLRVETLAQSLDIDLNRLAMGMPFILEGEAQEWFWIFQREHPNSDWQFFRDAMSHQFSRVENQFEIWDQIRSRKQKVSETFGQFYIAVAAIAGRLRPPLEEAQMIELLRANMNHNLRTALLYQPSYSLRQLHDSAMQFEKLQTSVTDFSREARPPQRRISELAYVEPPPVPYCPDPIPSANSSRQTFDLYPLYETVDAISAANKAEKLVCWNCDEVGHTFFDCTVATKNVFCYGCGAKNTYRPTCLRCRPGNVRQGVVQAPATRPIQPASQRKTPNPFGNQ